MKNISTGKILITIVAVWAASGSYIFDWNNTHIFNAHWPPHAKFHNAQDMLLGSSIGLLSVWVLWVLRIETIQALGLSVLLASLYWVTQAGALLFPGTALTDPEFSYPGQAPAQLIVDGVMLVILGVAYALEWRRVSDRRGKPTV